ncbi:hypothetical protein [Nocardioides sp. YIM 152315]|uniref:hypothetical protein n=1 Tax=Nocardioides sp. YIM 152315 TaxID=3031760 RepID=UPI0023DBC6C9|nr:hypothetical protein [Nocardioides sp. YIM 152315]MDF1605661.1 hypothetical protein [Nocardioides sp. YIM 152315]
MWMYLAAPRPLLEVMQRHPEARRAWRSLSPAEKQQRLARLRRAQQLQLARDARVLRVVSAG